MEARTRLETTDDREEDMRIIKRSLSRMIVTRNKVRHITCASNLPQFNFFVNQCHGNRGFGV